MYTQIIVLSRTDMFIETTEQADWLNDMPNCHAYRQHVMTLVVCFFAFFLLDVEFAEEVEGYDGVKVDDDA